MKNWNPLWRKSVHLVGISHVSVIKVAHPPCYWYTQIRLLVRHPYMFRLPFMAFFRKETCTLRDTDKVRRCTNLMQTILLWFYSHKWPLHVSDIHMSIFRSSYTQVVSLPHVVLCPRCCGCGPTELVCSHVHCLSVSSQIIIVKLFASSLYISLIIFYGISKIYMVEITKT